MITVDLLNEEESKRFAEQLADCLSAPLIITLSGDLGSGKTTLVRAMLRCLGIQSPIKSPTFSLVESYLCQGQSIHHFDLYRIHHEEELAYLGFRDYFTPRSICCIEWPEHAGRFLPEVDISIELSIKELGRRMTIGAHSAKGNIILACLSER